MSNRVDTLGAVLARAAADHPEGLALIDGGTRLTYAELALGCARTLVGLGVAPGDVVTVQLPSWWETAVLLHGCALAGAVFNPVVPIYREHELGFIVAQARPKLLVVPTTHRGHDHLAMARALTAGLDDPPVVLTVRGGADELVLDGSGPSAALTGCAPTDTALPVVEDPGAVALLMYTSGSTADPKGALHSHRTLLAEARQVSAICRLGGEDVVFMASPLAHITGLVFAVVLPADLGIASVLQDRWDAEAAVDLVEANGCTFTVSATTFLLGFTRVHEERGTRSSLRVFVCGGAEIGPLLCRRARTAMGTAVVRTYGSTELPTFTLGDPFGDPGLAGDSDGAVVPGASWRTDPETGELLVRGEELFLGYLDAALDAVAFTPDGYFHTGDLVRIDAEGYGRVVGRTKDIIIRGGENLSAIEIEDHVQLHPGVAAVAVVAVPDPTMGERACAYVVLADGGALTLAELREFLVGQGLAVQKSPERLEIVSELPHTASGKVQKFKLRQWLAGTTATTGPPAPPR